jgi:hypothetical protein
MPQVKIGLKRPGFDKVKNQGFCWRKLVSCVISVEVVTKFRELDMTGCGVFCHHCAMGCGSGVTYSVAVLKTLGPAPNSALGKKEHVTHDRHYPRENSKP